MKYISLCFSLEGQERGSSSHMSKVEQPVPLNLLGLSSPGSFWRSLCPHQEKGIEEAVYDSSAGSDVSHRV